jgi:hypothetical protein
MAVGLLGISFSKETSLMFPERNSIKQTQYPIFQNYKGVAKAVL